jgi:NMD protein affecting ribosome stability and mRNA decay
MSKEFDEFIQSIHQINGICIACDKEKLTHEICMDCIVKTNHEISDEEINKEAKNHRNYYEWLAGAKWYREQLRLKLKGGQDES